MDNAVIQRAAQTMAEAMQSVVDQYGGAFLADGEAGIQRLVTIVADSLAKAANMDSVSALAVAKIGVFGALAQRVGQTEAYLAWARKAGLL